MTLHQSESLYTLTCFNPADIAKHRYASYLSKEGGGKSREGDDEWEDGAEI